MTPERWREIQTLLHAALQEPHPLRAAFLERACGADADLRAEVASLLASADEAGDFLETPPQNPTAFDTADEELQRGRIGAYRVDRLLGRGGMGHVYLAVRADEQYEKRVAIKVVKRGTDTGFVLRRFRQERQILAALDHPNIARLLDGGNTDDGLPYFVMEYVEGEPITAFCARRELGLKDRLELFRTVCGAVQFAHQNFVVHRDLKPGNILVTADGVPKLLDFGIAKLLDPSRSTQSAEVTMEGLRVFTPVYASPEQIRGESITTASDVYSLGVLLYELLAGRRPYRARSRTPGEIERKVLEEEPERPSTAVTRPTDGGDPTTDSPPSRESQKLRRLLTGDLDAIVLKAMRKEPHRRYATVEQLSEDLRRHLEGLPVQARGDTFGYRMEKFLRRHAAGTAAAALVLLSLLGGIAATSWQARIARRERERADRRLEDVRRLANSFLFEFHNAIANLAGSTPARELLVRRALEYLETLAREAGNDRSLQRELAEAYEKLGEIQGGGGANLGDTAGAISSFRTALGMREELLASDGGQPRDAEALAACLETLAGILGRAGSPEESLRLARRALALREGLVRSDPASRPFRSGLARAHFFLSNQLFALNRPQDQIAEMEKARDIYGALAAEDPADLKTRRSLSLTHKYLASVRTSLGESEVALEGYRKSEAIERDLVAAEPASALYKQDLSHSYAGIGEALFALGRVAEGAESYRRAIALRKELADADPKNAGIREALGRGYLHLGRQQARYGDPREAVGNLALAIRIFEALAASDPGSPRKIASTAKAHAVMGMAHEKIAASAPRAPGRESLEETKARESYRKARDLFEGLERQGKLTPQESEELKDVLVSLERVSAAPGGRPAREPPSGV